MRHLLALAILFIAPQIFAQDPIKIEERNEKFSVGMKNSLVSNVPLGTKEFIEDLIKSEVKKFKGKVKHDEEFFIEQATKTTVTEKPVDVYIKIISIAGGKVELAWAINLGGAYLNKAEHPDMYRKAEQRIYDIVKNISTKAVDEEVKEEEGKLKEMEKELEKLQKDKEKLEKDIEKSNENIESYKSEIKVNEASQEGKKAEIKALHDQANSDADALKEKNKELDRLLKDKEKLQKKIKKEEENIAKAQDDIKANEVSQEDSKKLIEDKKKYIEDEVKSKYANIK